MGESIECLQTKYLKRDVLPTPSRSEVVMIFYFSCVQGQIATQLVSSEQVPWAQSKVPPLLALWECCGVPHSVWLQQGDAASQEPWGYPRCFSYNNKLLFIQKGLISFKSFPLRKSRRMLGRSLHGQLQKYFLIEHALSDSREISHVFFFSSDDALSKVLPETLYNQHQFKDQNFTHIL